MLTSLFLWLAAVVPQHCGGPCEVPRGADPVSADPRFTLTAGPEKANWRYLFNWIWTEDGEPKHRLEDALGAPPLRDFGYRRMFVSPAANGFLVTGNPYSRRRIEGREPPLFVFCDPQGNRVVEVPLPRALTERERRLGKCPGCDCADVLYVFEADPRLSSNGCYVELTACDTRRRLAFFLPLGLPVTDRERFEGILVAAEWAAVAPARRDPLRKEIAARALELGSADAQVQARAAEALATSGWLALEAVRRVRTQATSDAVRNAATAIEDRLRPWQVVGWRAMAIDLGLLGSLLLDPDEDVQRAVLARLIPLLPPLKGMDARAAAVWIERHRAALKWNEAKGRYEQEPR